MDGTCRAIQKKAGPEEVWKLWKHAPTGRIKLGWSEKDGEGKFLIIHGDKTLGCDAHLSMGTEWEIEVRGTKVAFKSMQGNYLTNEPPGFLDFASVMADRTAAGPWEEFSIHDAKAPAAKQKHAKTPPVPQARPPKPADPSPEVNLCSVCDGSGPTLDTWVCTSGVVGHHRVCKECFEKNAVRDTITNPYPPSSLCGIKNCDESKNLNRICRVCEKRQFRGMMVCKACARWMCLQCILSQAQKMHSEAVHPNQEP